MRDKKRTAGNFSFPMAIGKVEAIDRKGTKYPHEVSLILDSILREETVCLRFGHGPIFYSLDDFIKECPFNEDFCIDVMGRNHGSDCPVFVKKEDMNNFVGIAMKLLNHFYQ